MQAAQALRTHQGNREYAWSAPHSLSRGNTAFAGMSFCGTVTDCSGELLTMESPEKLTQKAAQQTVAAVAPFTKLTLQKLPAAAANISAAKAVALQLRPPSAVRNPLHVAFLDIVAT